MRLRHRHLRLRLHDPADPGLTLAVLQVGALFVPLPRLRRVLPFDFAGESLPAPYPPTSRRLRGGEFASSVLLEGPQERALGLPHLLEEAVDLLQRARGCGKRIQHQRVACGPTIPPQQSLHDQLVNGHM